MEGWISGNLDIDKFIKDTMCKPASWHDNNEQSSYQFLEWVPFKRFKNIKKIEEGGFSKVYSVI
jgi:hypothetical protein